MALAVIASFDHGGPIRTRRPRQTPRFRASWLRTRAIWGARSACPTRRAVRRAGPSGDGWRPEVLRAPPPDALCPPQGSRSGAPNQRPAASLPALCLASCGDCVGLSLLMTSSLLALCWGSRERTRERDPTGESAGPASLDQWPRTPRLCAIALRSQSSSRLKSHTPGQLEQDTPLQTPHRTTAAERFQDRDPAAQHVQATVGRWNQAPVVVAND
jgi:hypothetical protein